MSLVAVVESERDLSGALAKTQIVPVGMPEDTAFTSYFAKRRAASAGIRLMRLRSFSDEGVGQVQHSYAQRERYVTEGARLSRMVAPAYGNTPEELLSILAGTLEPDGGLPGESEEMRLLATLLALLCFVASGSTREMGTYRRHVDRLIAFVEAATLPIAFRETTEELVDLILDHGPAHARWEHTARCVFNNSEVLTSKVWASVYDNLTNTVK